MRKRLNSRLRDLEASSRAPSELTMSDKRLLVSLLAKRDALFWPWRYQSRLHDALPVIMRRQREYLAGVTGIAAKSDGRNWKDAAEQRQRLLAAGLLTAAVSGGQITSVFLTIQGEASARGLVGVRLAEWWDEGVRVAARLHKLAGEKPNIPIRESVLWKMACVGSPASWDHLTEQVLPAITAGIVRANSDTVGRVVYSLVPDAKLPTPSIHVDYGTKESWADSHYIAAFDRERQLLEALTPESGNECFIPLPASGWGTHFQEDHSNEQT